MRRVRFDLVGLTIVAILAPALPGTPAAVTMAQAQVTSLTINKCLAAKIKLVGRAFAGQIGCYSKGAAKPPVNATCLTKSHDKLVTAFAKTDAKYGPTGCPGGMGDGGARADEVDVYAASVNTDAGSAAGTCDAAKQKCVGKYVVGVMGCEAKAANKIGTVDTVCTGNVGFKLFDGLKGCLDKAAATADCTHVGNQGSSLKAAADAAIGHVSCALDPSCQLALTPTPTPSLAPGAPTPTPAEGSSIPTTSGALQAWLEAGNYLGWPAESAPHPSSGPHFGAVRTFLNPIVFDSLATGRAMHPSGAAMVKELYGSGSTVEGWSVMVKVQDKSAGGAGWYWYERFGGSTFTAGTGVAVCSSCHVLGKDYVRTQFPLQ